MSFSVLIGFLNGHQHKRKIRCNVKFCRTTIEEWTPNEEGGFDIEVSEPMVNDYEYYPFAIPVSHDYIELECLRHG